MDLKPVPFCSLVSAYEQQAENLLAAHRAADPTAIDLFHRTQDPIPSDSNLKQRT